MLGLYFIGQFFTSEPDEVTSSVDWEPAAQSARGAAKYEVLAPEKLEDGWRATLARYDPTTERWRLGLLDKDDEYLGLEQSKESATTLLERIADGSEPLGSAKVLDRVWSVYVGPGDRITYVHEADDVNTVITGTVEQPELESYISSLR